MTIPDTIKNELHTYCKRIVSLLGLKQGSVEIHCLRGEPKEVHAHDNKSIKFDDKLKT